MRSLPLRVRITALVVATAAAAVCAIAVLGGIAAVDESIAVSTLESGSDALAETDASMNTYATQVAGRIHIWADEGGKERFQDWDRDSGLPGVNIAVLDPEGVETDLLTTGPVAISESYRCRTTAGSESCDSANALEDEWSSWLVREVTQRATEISDGVPTVVQAFVVEDLATGEASMVRLDTDIFAASETEITTGFDQLLIVALPLLLLLLGVITWISLGRALSPVESMRAQLDGIGAESLDQRIPVPGADDELQHLAETMNRMLDRLQRASESQRRFISDASHELRSPITATGATIEVARANPEDTNWAHVAAVVEEENVRLSELVDDLLLLARLDEDRRPANGKVDVVDLEEVCLAEAERPHPVEVAVRVVAPARVIGNLATLTRAIRNLVDNAAAHATSRVRLDVGVSGSSAEVIVCDDGSGVPPHLAEDIFERFVRVDQSRTRDGQGGAGLGLAIARGIAESHGGTVQLAPPSEPGTTFVLRVPLAATASKGVD